MNRFGDALIAGVSAVVTLAIIATLVSNRANTARVITSAGQAFGGVISAATSPYSDNSFGARPSFGDY